MRKDKTVQLGSGLNKKRSGIRRLLFDYYKHRYLMLMLLPVIAYYILFHYVPFYGIQLAFKQFRVSLGIWKSPWVGMENFVELFSKRSFREILRNTVLISLYKLIFGFPAPIIFALILNEVRLVRFKKFVQGVSYLPHFISWVVLGGILIQLLSPSTGPVNIFLKSIGVKPIYFLTDTSWFRTVLVVTSILKSIGWSSIIYLATLASVPSEQYEAATIDGASRFAQLMYISLPSLYPVISIMIIFAVGGILNDDFDQIFNLYNAAVYSVSDVLSTYTYRIGLEQMQYGFATAVGLFKNVIGFALILISNRITNRINEYGVW